MHALRYVDANINLIRISGFYHDDHIIDHFMQIAYLDSINVSNDAILASKEVLLYPLSDVFYISEISFRRECPPGNFVGDDHARGITKQELRARLGCSGMYTEHWMIIRSADCCCRGHPDRCLAHDGHVLLDMFSAATRQ